MKNAKKLLAMLLAVCMVVALFAACGQTEAPAEPAAPSEPATPDVAPEAPEAPAEPMSPEEGEAANKALIGM